MPLHSLFDLDELEWIRCLEFFVYRFPGLLLAQMPRWSGTGAARGLALLAYEARPVPKPGSSGTRAWRSDDGIRALAPVAGALCRQPAKVVLTRSMSSRQWFRAALPLLPNLAIYFTDRRYCKLLPQVSRQLFQSLIPRRYFRGARLYAGRFFVTHRL